MSQILLHAKDNESKNQQINTTTLSLKSIVGNEKKNFEKLSKYEDSLENAQKNTNAIIKRLTNVLNNLYKAADEMVKVYSKIYLVRNKMDDYNNLLEDWNYVPCGQNCDASYGCGGSYSCYAAFTCQAAYNCTSCYGSCNRCDDCLAGEGCGRRE